MAESERNASNGPAQKARGPGAQPPKSRSALAVFSAQHREVASETLRRLRRHPVSTFMICLVIGISLALPSGLMALLGNLQHFVGDFDDVSRMTIYLKLETKPEQVTQLKASIQAWPEVKSVEWVTREQALEEFRQASGLGQALSYLNHNPLPDTLIVTPQRDDNTAQRVEVLLPKLEKLPLVDQVQLDLLWLQRLMRLAEVLERAALALGALLAMTVLLVTGNTIRLAIENRREEIMVVKLVGGTDGFVRRPFLYTGAYFGLGGGIFALLLVAAVVAFLNVPVRDLALLYNARFALAGLGFEGSCWVLLAGVLLGWCGAWLAVKRHLKDIEPS